MATGLELAEALKSQGKQPEALKVFNLSKQIATTVRLEELVRGAETEFQQVPSAGDTARGAALPAPAGPPPKAKTDTLSKPGAKKP